jgi:two-component system chemotaxis response regulator CheB
LRKFCDVNRYHQSDKKEFLMPGHDIIVIGASAGGVEALAALTEGLPADLPAAVFVVLHIPAFGISVLPAILSRRGALPARHPADWEPIRPGHIYIAPPDHHLLIEDGYIRLSRGPSENGHRPAVDVLFRSAARSYGPRVIGVVLTGALDDGTAGLLAIKQRSGLAVVQDPTDALFESMPHSAMDHVAVDHVVPLEGIAPLLATLTYQMVSEKDIPNVPDEMQTETEVAAMNAEALETPRAGTPSGYTCPECHGALWEVEDKHLIRFRCRVGHAYSPDSLIAHQVQGLEDALWIALRALEESAALAGRLAERAKYRGHDLAASRFEQQVEDTMERAAIVRRALNQQQKNAAETSAEMPGKDEVP